jgi:hypothetical protein
MDRVSLINMDQILRTFFPGTTCYVAKVQVNARGKKNWLLLVVVITKCKEVAS